MNRLYNLLIRYIKENQYILISVWCIGLLAHLFVFTNKLANFDDVPSLYGLGTSIEIGRWGLWLLKYLIPPFSMPWFHGIVCLLLISLSASFIVKIFGIRSSLIQTILGASIVSLPCIISVFCFMFTSSAYLFSFFLSVLVIYFFNNKNYLYSILCLCFSLSIYQAFIAVSISLFWCMFTLKIMDSFSYKQLGKWIIVFFLILISGIVLYLIVSAICLYVQDKELSSYIIDQAGFQVPLIDRLLGVFSLFFKLLYSRSQGLINTRISTLMHIVLLVSLLFLFVKYKKTYKFSIIIVLANYVFLLPFVVNIMYVVSPLGWNTLTLFSFVSIYIIICVLLDRYVICDSHLFNILVFSMLSIVVNNIYYANRTYLQMHIIYENTYSFYTSLVSEIKNYPGFDKESKIAIVGEAKDLLYEPIKNDFYNNQIRGTSELINSYSRNHFIKFYCGFNCLFASTAEIDDLISQKVFGDMPIYPYYGSIKKIDNYIVVKLNNIE